MEQPSLNALAEQISPCQRALPYLYVSYSTRDGMAVYQTVLALQKAGINIWIDVPQNFNTGGGYNSSIFEALASEQCRGILFFASEHSMTSAQSAKEIAYSKADGVVLTHPKPHPIIIVELQDIENHDMEVWVNGALYQKFGEEALSLAETGRIDKYRAKYNQKMPKLLNKYDLANMIVGVALPLEYQRIDYRPEVDVESIKKAAEALLAIDF